MIESEFDTNKEMEFTNLPHIEIKTGVLSGKTNAPPSKSITHRLLIIAALSGQRWHIKNPLFSDDTRITLDALNQMGFSMNSIPNEFVLDGTHKNIESPSVIFFGNSGTSARLLTAVAASISGEFHLDGTERMRQRPMFPLINALQQLGAEIEHQNGYLPMDVSGGNLKGGEVIIDASQSSQFISALLLIAPYLKQDLTILPEGTIASSGYVDLTFSLMRKNGIEVKKDGEKIVLPGNQNYVMRDDKVEGDYSSASYFLAGAALTGGSVTVSNLEQSSHQSDQIILEILSEAGARVVRESDKVIVKGGKIKGIDMDMQSCPDIVPTVAVMALFATGDTRMRNVRHLQFKESDRLKAIQENISRLGGESEIEGNDLIIKPRPLKGATLPTYDDHRIAMSFALAGLRVKGVSIENPKCVEKSFPEFWREFYQMIQIKEN